MVYFFYMNEEGGVLLEEEKESKRFYQWSFWWVNNRYLLRRMGYGLFIAFDAILLLFGGWHLMDAFAISYDAEQNNLLRMVAVGQEDLHRYSQAHAAEDLRVEQEKVIAIGDSQFDLFSFISNPNEDWWAEFTYTFSTNNSQTESKQGFILPNQEKPIVEFAIHSETPVTITELSIENIRWHRIDAHITPNYPAWSEDRLRFLISNPQFLKETRFDGEVYGRSTFSILNETAFSYYDVGLFIILKRGNTVVGINRTLLSQIESQESIDMTVNWFGVLPAVSQIEVVPELNIFDIDVYKPLTGETTQDTRTRVF